MRMNDVINALEGAATDWGCRTIVRGDVFKLSALPGAQYPVFAWTQGTHRETSGGPFISYEFTLFYTDRTTADGGNVYDVQSEGIHILGNIIRTLADAGIYCSEWAFTPFEQRFTDECAGVFTTVQLRTPVVDTCASE